MHESLGFAIMGCGRISKRHAGLLSSEAIAGAHLVAACDPRPDRADEFAASYNKPAYTSLQGLLEMHDAEIDAVCVLTESGHHAEHAIEVARAGKHVIVEKPMALTLEDADRMIEACDRAGVKLFVVKQNRFNTPVQLVRKAFEAGYFGKMVMGTVRVRWRRDQAYFDQDDWRGTWALDGGVFANQASHHIDLLQWFLGNPVSVFAKSRAALVDIECDDTGGAIIEFQGGALGIVEATTATRPIDLEGSLSLLGERGSVVIGGFAVNEITTWNFEDEAANALFHDASSQNDSPPDVYGFGHRAYLGDVVRSIRNTEASLVDGLEGRRSLELVSAIYESLETGREITLGYRQAGSRLGKKR